MNQPRKDPFDTVCRLWVLIHLSSTVSRGHPSLVSLVVQCVHSSTVDNLRRRKKTLRGQKAENILPVFVDDRSNIHQKFRIITRCVTVHHIVAPSIPNFFSKLPHFFSGSGSLSGVHRPCQWPNRSWDVRKISCKTWHGPWPPAEQNRSSRKNREWSPLFKRLDLSV